MDCVVAIVTTLGQYTVAPLGRQFGYLIFYKGNLNSLRNQSQKLKAEKDALQQRVDAKKNVEDILPNVELWLTKAEECYQLAPTLEHENEANKWCLRLCPNLKSRYSLGKKAKKLAEDMERLCKEGNFPIVSTPKPSPPTENTFEESKSFKSRATVMENVMQALKDDKIRVIGICGMGGVGKTTMAHAAIKTAKERKLFDEVVMVPVTKTPNVWKIQADIAFFLNLNVPSNAETTDARACWLVERIREKKRILFVLDDIWNALKLKEIGIPYKDHESCKILLTSRSEQAVKETGADSNDIFAVGVLHEEEAWSLFKEKAGISEDSIHPANLLSTQRAVANECKGLPLALSVVGGTLRDADTDSWEYALQQLRQAMVDNLPAVEDQVYGSLKYSYDQLKSEGTKKYFLLCSVYPEDYEIPVEDLVRYGFAHRLFKAAKKLGEARNAAYCMVNTLKKCYLLSNGIDEEHVKMHDMVRDVAMSIASKEEHPFIYDDEALKDSSEDEHKRYAVISFQHLGEDILISNLVFPKLWLFRLTYRGVLEIPNNFYQGMKQLNVLALSNIHFWSLPTSLGDLSSLHTLLIEQCQVNRNMSVIGELKDLEILSLKYSKVTELPVEMENLTRLKLLDLYGCEIEMIAPGILSSLSSLEEIYIGPVKKHLFEHITELSSLSNLVVLSIQLLDHDLWPRNWTLEKMKNFDINLGRIVFSTERYKLSNALWLEEIDVSAVKESGLRNILKSSKVLDLHSIRGLKDIFYDFGEDNFENLTFLGLEDCQTIEYLINATHGDPERAFPVIETLELTNLERLRRICPIQPQKGMSNATTSSFSNTKVTSIRIKEINLSLMDNLIEIWPGEFQVPFKLRSLRVHICPQLNGDLLPLNWIKCGMKDLETVYVKECQSIEVAFNLEGLTTTVKEFGDANQLVALPMLQNLKLCHLPKLTHVWKINATSPCSFQGFQKLTSIKIKGCSSLRNLFPTCVAKLLQNLKRLKIHDCEAMEAIFEVKDPKIDDHDNQGASSSSMVVLLPQLETLKLAFLPNLRSLCSQGFTFPGTCLERLEIFCCPYIEQHCWGDVDQVEIIPKPTDIRFLDGKVILSDEDEANILVRGMDEPADTWYGKVEEEFQGFLPKVEAIFFIYCEKLLSVASSNSMEKMPNLRWLGAWGCNSMETLFDLTRFDSKKERVNQLKELMLIHLPKLVQIWKNTPQQSCHYFPGLTKLEVQNCDCLRYIFTVSMAKSLVNLKNLTIVRCEKVEKIVAWDEGGKEEEEEEEVTRGLFASYCYIKVKNLPNLICIGPKEDDGQLLTTENLDMRVKFCRKYRGFQSG